MPTKCPRSNPSKRSATARGFFETSDTAAAVVGREGGMGTVGAVSFSAIVLVDKASDVGYGTEVEALEAWPPYRLVRLDTMDYCK